jgi:hypothetical protein
MKKLSRIVALLSILPGFCFEAVNAIAQDSPPNLPPIIPAIQRESVIREVRASNSNQGAPVRVSARMQVSDRAYGNGYLKMRNVGNKEIIAFRGAWVITTSEGGVIRDHWNFGASSSLWISNFSPGEEARFPIPGPPNLTVQAPQKIARFSVIITGILFADRTWWGDDGYAVYENVRNDGKISLKIAKRLRAACQQTSPEKFDQQASESVIKKALEDMGEPAYASPLYQGTFQRLIFDRQNAMRPDAMANLDRVISSLKTFLRKEA